MTKQICKHLAVSSALLGLLLSAPLTWSQAGAMAKHPGTRAVNPDEKIAGARTEVSSSPSYTYTLLGIPDTLTSELSGINLGATTTRMEIVGGGPAGGSMVVVAGTGTVTETYQPVNYPNVGAAQYAEGVNDSGDIVGTYTSGSGKSHGYELIGTNFTSIKVPFAGASNTFADAINNSGEIVGEWNTAASGTLHSFTLIGGTYTAFDYPGANYTEAANINTKGDIVGQYGIGGVQHGFLLSGGTFTSFDPPTSISTSPFGINDAGDIVGSFCETTECESTDEGLKGFLLSKGVYTTIEIPNEFYTLVSAINNKGVIVGYYQDAGGQVVSFLATPNP